MMDNKLDRAASASGLCERVEQVVARSKAAVSESASRLESSRRTIEESKARVHASSRVKVLLVEDDGLVQDVVLSMLEDADFRVVTADAGAEAIAILINSQDDEFCAVVTDVNLGSEPDGWHVGRRARETSARLGVVYCSGDSAHAWAVHGVPASVMLPKPFRPEELIAAVHRACAEAAQLLLSGR